MIVAEGNARWRLWSLVEIKELLLEAGFSRVRLYWERTDEDDEGTGKRGRPRVSENADRKPRHSENKDGKKGGDKVGDDDDGDEDDFWDDDDDDYQRGADYDDDEGYDDDLGGGEDEEAFF